MIHFWDPKISFVSWMEEVYASSGKALKANIVKVKKNFGK